MPCPNCGAGEDHVVVNNIAFCKACGPSVWGGASASAAVSVPVQAQPVVVQVSGRGRRR